MRMQNNTSSYRPDSRLKSLKIPRRIRSHRTRVRFTFASGNRFTDVNYTVGQIFLVAKNMFIFMEKLYCDA